METVVRPSPVMVILVRRGGEVHCGERGHGKTKRGSMSSYNNNYSAEAAIS